MSKKDTLKLGKGDAAIIIKEDGDNSTIQVLCPKDEDLEPHIEAMLDVLLKVIEHPDVTAAVMAMGVLDENEFNLGDAEEVWH